MIDEWMNTWPIAPDGRHRLTAIPKRSASLCKASTMLWPKKRLAARWVDLIKHLNEKEDQQREVHARLRERSS